MGRARSMIGNSLDASREAYADIQALSRFGNLDDKMAALCAAVSESIADPDFPGAIIPSLDGAGDLHVIVAAPTKASWRRLTPVLVAFAGPTVTSFNGLPTALVAGQAVADRVAQTQPAVTGVMGIPANAQGQVLALRALARGARYFCAVT